MYTYVYIFTIRPTRSLRSSFLVCLAGLICDCTDVTALQAAITKSTSLISFFLSDPAH